MNIGILDLGIFDLENETAENLLNQSFSYVEKADILGFSRYWFAEHHAPDTIIPLQMKIKFT
ncbi:hypothetical protein [Psychroflexus maritimus]|uniref:Luciferase-like monooxygenase n=1 Tax=Psychroflexus maritimus TaxID=2714865 RepID=A0A967DXJ7_9FLAO|nr:hypothetical protein [Psychroflexus maritimus]NGZ88745.1 hypothetical protein [Psychroflexus maritimus]